MLKLEKAQTKEQIKNIKKLYKKAFPRCERKPFKTFFDLKSKDACDMFVITDEEGTFFGLAITIKNEDIVLLTFFAIHEKFRNQGIGSKALKLIQNYYKNSRIIIEIEDPTYNKAKNILQRIKRKTFYLNNNMVLQDYKILLLGLQMEILTFNGKVSFDEYHGIFEKYFSPKIYNRIVLDKSSNHLI